LVCVAYSSNNWAKVNAEKDSLIKKSEFKDCKNASEIQAKCFQYLNEINVAYQAVMDKYTFLNLDSQSFNKAIQENYIKLKTFHELVRFNEFQKFFDQIVKLYNDINPNNFTLNYKTLIVSDNADVINYKFQAKPIESASCITSQKPINLNYTVNIRTGLKLDISTGLFANLGLNNNTYRFDKYKNSDTLKVVVKNKNESKFIPSVGFLLHAYRRTPANIKLAGCFGISTSDATKLKYYVGGSLIFGRSQRFILNFGLAGQQINVAADEYAVGKIFNAKNVSLPESVPFAKEAPFMLGGFIGITVNLSGSSGSDFTSNLSKISK
jgi:hypothetical protein